MSIVDKISQTKPRERLRRLGVESLSDYELISLILRTGSRSNDALILATKVFNTLGGYSGLMEASIQQLSVFEGIGFSKACSIKASIELATRVKLETNEKLKIESPGDVFDLLRKDFHKKKKEHMYVVSVDSRNNLISRDLVSIGTVDAALMHPREIFRVALMRNSKAILLVHNHPSGDVTPSEEDILITERIAKVGKIMGISLMDHIIISASEYASMKALGFFKIEEISTEDEKFELGGG